MLTRPKGRFVIAKSSTATFAQGRTRAIASSEVLSVDETDSATLASRWRSRFGRIA